MASASPAFATDGLYLPPSPSGPGGQDSIRTSDGAQCSQSMNSNGAYMDVGVIGTSQSSSNDALFNFGERDEGDPKSIAYARVTIPLGRQPGRIDCNRLYELEVQRLKEEINMLRMGLQ